MKIDRGKCKKVLTEVPVNCKSLIQKLKTCNEDELVKTLREITVWEYGKCELYHWIDVLDRFDLILARVSQPESNENQALIYLCRRLEEKQLKNLVYYVLYFTALLIEHAYARHLYSSIEHLTTLLAASDMDIVLAVLNLLYVFSKRSNFISRLSLERRLSLQLRLNHLAESWGGKENGFGLASCCEDKPLTEFPPTATTLHYEFYISGSNGGSSHRVIQLEKMNTYTESSARIMEELVPTYMVPTGKQMGLLTHIRLAQAFSDYSRRLQCVQARLQAISILVYSNAGQDILQSLLYPGLIEELVDVLGVSDSRLTDIKAAALRTLTAIIHLERTPRINAIIDATGMSSYHGFFPSLFRGCVLAMIGESSEVALPPALSTALFSFLYHLASYESGGEALVSCGMMETLLRIVQWRSVDNSQLTFVTRAVRLVDLITNMDITTFTNFSGLTCLISRLEYEVNTCRTELGEENILTSPSHPFFDGDDTPLVDKEALIKKQEESKSKQGESSTAPLEITDIPKPAITLIEQPGASGEQAEETSTLIPPKSIKIRSQCIPQRSALLKSILNFLKKAIPDPTFSDCIRNVMDDSLPTSLKHIISKAEYYGPSLFLLATEVVTVYVFHEPSLLSCLQDRKLTDVILDALVVKEVPPTREVIASLPNILSALCLNQRGLEAFMKCKPFDRLFHVLLSPQYLPAMRRRRSSDSLGDTATNLGTAMDELMRHQPTLRQDAMTAIIKLLKEVCDMGEDEKISVQSMSLLETERQEEKGEDISDEDDDIEENGAITKPAGEVEEAPAGSKDEKKRSVPLMEYIYNVVRFIDAILSNNATDDHCKEFVRQGGLDPLVRIPSLPNVVIEFSSSPACMGVGMAMKGILTLSQEGTVINQCLTQIDSLINKLEPLFTPTNESILLNELINSKNPTQPFLSCKSTPLLHTVTALESYVTLLINLCKVGQVDLRTVCITQWGAHLPVIDQLSKLFNAVVWESTMLDLLCPPHSHTRPDLQRLIEAIGPNPTISVGNEQKIKDKKEKSAPPHIRLIKPLWRAVSGLCGHLTPFLSVLCKLSCGSTVRVRRTQNYPPAPSKHQHEMGEHIIGLLVSGLKWRPPENVSSRASLTFLNCSIGLTAQLLFSDQQHPYHLMLQEFNKRGGLQLLVECYEWANKLPRQDEELADGSGEFLNVWLSLIEKLINVKLITETTHALPSTPSPTHKPFDPIVFLSKSHKCTFDVVTGLWHNLTYSYANMKTLKTHIGVMTENVIIILKHLLKGDVQDLLRKKTGELAPTAPTSGEPSTAATPAESSVVPSEHLIVQLVDMGFSFQRASEALIHSNNNLSAATEYVLTQPLASFPMADSDLTEEEAMMQAIAMSLGVGEGGEEDETPPEEEAEEELIQVTEKELWSLYDKILSGCIKLLEDVPSAVFRIGDLLAVAMDRKGDVFRSDTIANIVPLVVDGVLYVCDSLLKGTYSSQANSKNVAVLGAYLHCLLLISEDLKFSCGELFTETSLFHEHLLKLLRLYCQNIAKEGLTEGKPPGWLTPLILLFDNHEKMATMVQRRGALPKSEHMWQYYEERHGRWVNYHSTSNTTIERAYKAGETEVTFTSGRRHYLVLFNIMTQINEENGTPRPVMRIAKPSPDKAPKSRLLAEFLNPPTTASGEGPSTAPDEEMEVESLVQHFTETESAEIVVLCTQILGYVKEPDSVQAILRLLLRFTRNYRHAQLFAENKGLQHLIGLKEVSSFPGFSPLSTLIIRHMLEDTSTLESTIDNTIINFVVGNIGDDIPELRSGSHNSAKEIHNLLQKLIPIACRDEKLFVEGCKRMLRYTIPTSAIKALNDFSDLSNVIKEPFTVKTSGEAAHETPQISPLAKQCITCLLSRLTTLHNAPPEESETKPEGETLPKQVTWQAEEASPEPVRVSKKRRKTTHAADNKEKKYLINKSSILKLLAESVKSYQGVAEFIIDHTVINKEGETVSALTYIMDNLLAPPDKDSSLEDTHDYAKVILSTVAASNSSQAAKEKLVEQLKTSFNKALSNVESSFKHTKIQSLAGLMSIILESRVSGSNFVYNFGTVGGNSQSPPYIAKLLIAKGLVSDLAQVPHKLDLSSPHMASTINTCLKPLEILTRLIYQSVLANMPSAAVDKDKEADATTSPLRVDDIDNVVDQLLERVPTSSSLGASTTRHTNTMDDLAMDHMDIDEAHRDFDEDEGGVDDIQDQSNALIQEFAEGLNDAFNTGFSDRLGPLGAPHTHQHTHAQGGANPSMFDPGTPDDGDSFDDDDDDDNDDDDDDDDDDADDPINETHDEDGGVDDAVDGDENAVEEDEDGSEMDGDEEDMEIEDTSNLEGGTRTAAFNIRDFLNEEEDQFVTVMSSNRLNSARTHFSWANPSPAARARARANGATSTGLPPRHPLLAREGDTAAESSTTRLRDEGHIRLQLDPASTTPAFLQRLLGGTGTLNSTADAVFHLGSTRNTRTRLYLHDRDYVPSDLNDINPIVTGRAADAVSTPLPSALARWIEESLVLDGTSVQDLVQLIKPKILPTLEELRDKEVDAIRVVREAEIKEEEEKKAEEAKKKAEEEKVNNKSSDSSTTDPSSEVPSVPTEPSSTDDGELSSTVDTSEFEAASAPSAPSSTSLPLGDNPSPSELGPLLTSTLNMTSTHSSEGSIGATAPDDEEEDEESSVSSTDSVRTTELVSRSPINTLLLASGDTESSISSAPALPASLSDPASSSAPVAAPSGSEVAETAPNAVYIDGIAVPEGIDPSFLEALPDSIRREVLQEQSAALARQRRQATRTSPSTGVSPEFLAALPAHIQEEVLAQERVERGSPSTAAEGPQTQMNPTDFLMSLPSSLRQTVLADMEESQLPSLSQDLVDDYERLRTERARAVYNSIPPRGISGLSNLLQSATSFQRAFNIGSTTRNSLGPIFASTISPYTISGVNNNGSVAYKEEMKKITSLQEEVRKVVKKNPVEHEAITCLLVLLFIDESRLHTTRLHRVLRNLCCHTTSRTWILISLLSIIQKCSTGRKTSQNSKFNKISLASFVNGTNSWLTLSMNTSLGCKNNVFDLNVSSKGHMNSQEMIRIHPQASTVVCRRVLDLLVSLGRYFPNHFLSKSIIDSGLKYTAGPKDKKMPQAELLPSGAALTDFWDCLLGLEQVKGKAPVPKGSEKAPQSSFLACPMGQLMVMLDHPVVKNNQTLIDRLLRLLSVIALALPERTTDGAESSNLEPLPEDSPEANIERQHLQLVTNILTTGASSECAISQEGLEDGTSLLLQLSRVSARLRDLTLQLMLAGLQTVARDLQEQIKQLLDELREEHRKNPQKKQRKPVHDEKKAAIASSKVTLKAPHRDLHLPAMAHLTKKNSSQAYFLRILKVVVAVREVTIKSLQAEKDKETAEKEEKEKKEKKAAEEKAEEEGEEAEETSITDTTEEVTNEKKEEEKDKTAGMGPLSEQLKVPQLWSTLGDCLTELGSSNDHHAVLVLQPAVEAFFHVHGLDNDVKSTRRRAGDTLDLLTESPAPLSVDDSNSVASFASIQANYSDMSVDTHKYIMFAEQHRVVLNQILRQSTTPLSDGPFQALVNHTRVLDFDVKRRYFRQELEKIEETNRREDIAIRVKREHVFEESFRELHRRSPEELKSRLYVIFEGEEGQDAGGLLREWYQIIAREIFNPHYALFTTTPGDKITYVCNSFSHYNSNHLDYFKFVGRVIAKAIYDNKHLDCYFSRSFYKHILGQPVGFRDMEAEDYAFYKSMMFLLENNLEECGLDNLEFTMDIEEFGVTETRELKPGGKNIRVTDTNKKEYVQLISNMKMTGSIRSQIKAFLDGFYDIIPRHLISIFTDTELELLISGLPTIDIDDLKGNTEYHKYQPTSLQIQWFWRALRSFSQAERANFLQFVTGTSKVPLQGFSSLEGMNGVQKFQIHRDDRSTDRLPSAHTCFNQLDLPVYETYDKLRKMLLLSITECPEGFGLA